MKLTNTSGTSILVEGVIFDMDGLIYDSERLFFQQKQIVTREYGYTETEENYVQTLGLTGETLKSTMLSIYGKDYPFEEISKKSRENMMKFISQNGLPIKKGITQLLQFLKQNNIPCAIASSTHLTYIQEYLSKTNLSSYFSAVIGGDMIRHSKPEPDIFLEAAAALSLSPSQCLVLEDSENGILAAHNAGIPVICIPDMKQPQDTFCSLTFDLLSDASRLPSMFS